MASKPIVDAAPVSSLDATGYRDADSYDEFSGLYWTSIPSHVSFGNLLYLRFPSMVEESVNKALHKHVGEVRESLLRDEQYSDLAPYYDVVQDEEEVDIIHSGLFDVPDRLQAKALALEYGDSNQAPQGFLRKAALSGAAGISDDIKSNMDWAMGEVVVGV
jgi:hypothetical protein